jgi:hypothetical protein
MAEHQLTHLMVVAGKRPVGTVSTLDVAASIAAVGVEPDDGEIDRHASTAAAWRSASASRSAAVPSMLSTAPRRCQRSSANSASRSVVVPTSSESCRHASLTAA